VLYLKNIRELRAARIQGVTGWLVSLRQLWNWTVPYRRRKLKACQRNVTVQCHTRWPWPWPDQSPS